MDDGCVEPGLYRLVEEHRVEGPAGRRVEAERDVGHTEHRAGTGDLGLDPPDRLKSLHGIASQVLPTGRQREGECVEQQVSVGQPVLLGGELLDPVGDLELVVGRPRLARLVDHEADDRRAVLASEAEDPVETRAFALPVLEVGAVEDRPPSQPLERGLHDLGLRRVDHHRRRHVRGERGGQPAHVFDTVPAHVVDTEVDEMGPLLQLALADRDALLDVAGQKSLPERLRPVGVGPLPDDQERSVLVERDRRVDRGGGLDRPRHPVLGLSPADGGDHSSQVLGCCPTTTADDADAELGDEPRQVVGQVIGTEVVGHLPVDDLGQTGVGNGRDGHRRVSDEVTERLPHLGGAGGAIEADDIGSHSRERGKSGADLRAGQHPSGQLDRHLHLERDFTTRGSHCLASTFDGGLGPEQVELCLDDQQVGATIDQPRGLIAVGGGEVAIRDLAQRGELGARAHRPGDETTASVACDVLVDGLAGDGRGGSRDLVRPVGYVVLTQGDGERAERVGLDHVDSHIQEGAVEIGDDIGPGDAEDVDAPFELGAAEVVDGQTDSLQIGAGGTVEDDGSGRDGVQVVHEMLQALRMVSPLVSRETPTEDHGPESPWVTHRPGIGTVLKVGCRGVDGPVPRPL